ncbi:MAG: Tat pathway signal protein [Opitutia bacterium Tous-C4FEB]|nr:MAG: Tat pathway signal protein [Opitutae bacterium Tous-C5TDCM]PAW91235.1 MAG: Tat pathway signal protein [Opitutae bacterium Tous-C4FEB]
MKPFPQRPAAGIDRRTSIKWMFAAAASIALLDENSLSAATPASAVGYGTDPDLQKTYKPGDLWSLTFTEDQLRTATALCDTIIPADSISPAASTVGVPAFIDEWISAPYPEHDQDRQIVVEGLAWIEAESQRRFQSDFGSLILRQKNALCEDICLVAKAKPEFKTAARFFKRFRDLTAGGFYTTPEGMKDIGYVANVPLASFDGPPPEVLAKLGLA